ncbi:hypothetical protein FQZ97_707120 [compost metagenome]
MLSPREKTCLRWIDRSRTVAEIASLESKSLADIESCLQSALAALKAKSVKEALQKADHSESDWLIDFLQALFPSALNGTDLAAESGGKRTAQAWKPCADLCLN